MPKNPAGKGKSHVSTSVDEELANEIVRRAENLRISKGAYLREVLDQWYRQGAKPVSHIDALSEREARGNILGAPGYVVTPKAVRAKIIDGDVAASIDRERKRNPERRRA